MPASGDGPGRRSRATGTGRVYGPEVGSGALFLSGFLDFGWLCGRDGRLRGRRQQDTFWLPDQSARGQSGLTTIVTQVTCAIESMHMSGFGNEFETEALRGTLPVQKVAYHDIAESLHVALEATRSVQHDALQVFLETQDVWGIQGRITDN